MQKMTKREETHHRMIDAAGRSFREYGYTGIGVDAIAKQANATSGAFYAHLGSKKEAFKIALRVGLDEVISAIPAFKKEHGQKWPEAFIDYYLGKPHRDDLECGCVMTTLSPDVMRGDEEIRELYERKMMQISKLIAGGLRGRNRKSRAWAFLQVLIGGLTMSRAALTENTSNDIAQAARNTASQIAFPEKE